MPMILDEIIAFFPNKTEFNERVLKYLEDESIPYDIREEGIIAIDKSNAALIKNAGFNSLLAKDMNELYSKYSKELREYKKIK